MSVFGVILVSIQSKCGKIQTRITPNTDTFHAVYAIVCRKTLLIKISDLDENLRNFSPNTRIVLYALNVDRRIVLYALDFDRRIVLYTLDFDRRIVLYALDVDRRIVLYALDVDRRIVLYALDVNRRDPFT